MVNLRIHYLFVEETGPLAFHSIFHLLRQSEMALLRCFMAFLQLPSDAERIASTGRPFFEAVLRVRHVPTFRKAPVTDLPESLWKDLQDVPLLCLMLGHNVPAWISLLAEARPVIALSQFEKTVEQSRIQGVFPALLRGTDDLKVFYTALRELCRERSQDERLDDETRQRLENLGELDLFGRRSRLSFIPPIPLPQPHQGRPAAYLLNRLSNNVDEPLLDPDPPEDSAWKLPEILKWGFRASAALSLFELGDALPEELRIGREELEDAHTALSSGLNQSQKFEILMKLGQRIADNDFLASPFVAVPAARLDILRGQVPDGVNLEPDHELMVKPGSRALNDFLKNSTSDPPFETAEDNKAYVRTRETLLLEQRFLACETACLASRAGGIPFQIPVVKGDIYNTIRILNRAIETNSKKIVALFRGVERALAALMPPPMLDVLAAGDSSVQILSDLPLEWTLIDGWPLCLTRPVSRVPLGVTSWDVLSAALEQESVLNVKTPERVLVLDLVPQHDPIRRYSDSFASISEALAQHYVYAKPANVKEFRQTLQRSSAEIVVLDTHGQYDRSRDEVWIALPEGAAALDQLLPDQRVPPVWILSACDTSVTGAMRGCFVRRLLAKGAVCVIATLAPVDAFTAELFVGRLLTDLYNPVKPGAYASLDRLFFATQYTTALLYDPLLPLIRRAERDGKLKQSLGRVFGEYFAWAGRTPIEDVRRFRHDAAWFVGTALARHGLTEVYEAAERAGQVRPETLLFSAFGVPKHVHLT